MRWIGVGQGPEPRSLVRLHEVNSAPVGELRYRQPGNLAQCCLVVQRRRQELTRSGQQGELALRRFGLVARASLARQQPVTLVLGPLALSDVGNQPDRPDDLAAVG